MLETVDGLAVVVSHDDVELNNISSTFSTLSSLLVDEATVRRFQGSVSVSFDGFNHDPREIYEIPKIRRFCAELDKHFPYWLYFLSMEDSSLKTMAFCLCTVENAGPGLASVDGDNLLDFISSHLAAMNELFDRYSLDEATNRSISDNVAQYFQPE